MAALTVVVNIGGRPYRKRAIDRAQALAMGAGATGISVPTPSSAAAPKARGARGRGARAAAAAPGSGGTGFTVPKAKVGLLIGKKGTTVNGIRDRTGATLTISDEGDALSRVTAKGSEEAVAAALAEVRKIVAS